MESTRLDKVNRLLEKELAEILRQETAKTHGLMVSVSAVRTAPDLSFAKVFVSVFPSAQGNDIVANLNRQVGAIRGALGNRVRYQLRVIPELRFDIDDSLDYLERIDELLKK
ncbi:MAG: 30S ribosome-binding factor RbfA [Bacteroidales bacterium]|nr:30S ribosome-binding factor RbfA [Candidatus Liminaster caballi]